MSKDDDVVDGPVAANHMLGQLNRATRRERDILVALNDNPGSSVAALSEVLSLHVNTVREHLNGLRRRGLATVVEPERSGPGRPELIYYPVSAVPGQPLRFFSRFIQVLAVMSDLDDERCSEIGHAWAQELISEGIFVPGDPRPFPERLQDIMRMMGFAPTPAPDSEHLLLHTCPFRAGDEPVPRLMCRLHTAMATALADAEMAANPRKLRVFVKPAMSTGICGIDVDAG